MFVVVVFPCHVHQYSTSFLVKQLLSDTCEALDEEQLGAVKANILLLVGELVSQLKTGSLAHLPSIVPKVLSTLSQQDSLQRYAM